MNNQLLGSVSCFDNAENFYHGYLLRILGSLSGYQIRSNKEAGKGRPDMVLEPYHPRKAAMVIGIKHTKKFIQREEKCREALEQIEQGGYEAGLLDEGYTQIIKYGICFCKKNCMAQASNPSLDRQIPKG